MPTIAELRSANPWAEDMSDLELLDYRAQQTGTRIQDAAAAFGYDLPRSNTGANLRSGGHGYLAGLGSIGAALGSDSAQQFADSHRAQSKLYDSLSTAPKTFDDVHGAGDFLSYAGRLGAQSLPYAAEFAATAGLGGLAMRGTRAAIAAAEASGDVAGITAARAALGRGATTAGVVGSYPSAVGDILSNQYDQSGSYDFASAAAGGVPYAALNAVGLEGALTRGATRGLGQGLTGSRIANAGIKGAIIGTSEGASETGQELVNQYGRSVVDRGYDMFGDKAKDAYKESFIGGAILGGLPGGAAGMLQRKQPLEPGSDLLTGANPAREAYERAALVDNIRARREEQRAVQSGQDPIMVTPQGDALVDPVQVQAYNQFGQNMAPPQAAQPAQQENPLEQVQQFIVPKYGTINPIMGTDGPVGFEFMGQQYPTEEQAVSKMVALFKKESQKPQHILAAEQALVDANREILGEKATMTASQVNSYGNQIGITAANSPQNLVERLDAALQKLAGVKGNNALAKRELFTAWKSKLTGETVSQNVQPTVTVNNETQPQQVAPQAQAAAAAQTTQQASNPVAKAETRAREAWDEETLEGDPKFDQLTPEAKQEWAVAVLKGENTADMMETIIKSTKQAAGNFDSATQSEKLNSLLTKVFGARDAEIMLLATEKGMTQAEIGKLHGISHTQVQNILKRANPEALGRLRDEAAKIGMSEQDLKAALAGDRTETQSMDEEQLQGDGADIADQREARMQGADEVVLDKDELHGTEDAMAGMQIINSAGEAKGNIAKRTMGEEFIKAVESGDAAAETEIRGKFAEMEVKLKALAKEKEAAKTAEARDAIDVKIDRILARFAKSDKAQTVDTTVDNENITLTLTDIGTLLKQVPGLLKGVKQLITHGQEAVFSDVTDFYVYASGKKDECAFVAPHPNGGYLMAFNLTSVGAESDNWNAHIARHEFAHIADDAHGARIYSSFEGFKVTSLGKKLLPAGEIATELHDLYKSGTNLGNLFAYPLDTSKHKLPKNRAQAEAIVEAELFAQLYSAYTNPETRVELEAVAPQAAQFMGDVLNGIRQRSVQEASSGAEEASGRGQDQAADNRASGNAPEQRGSVQNPGRVQLDRSQRSLAKGDEGLTEPLFARTTAEVARGIAGESGARVVADTNHVLKKGIGNLTYLHDLVARFKDKLPSVTTWYKATQEHQVSRVRMEREAESVAALADKLSDAAYKKVNDFIAKSTFEQKWAYQPSWMSRKVTVDSALGAQWKALTSTEQAVIDSVFKHGEEVSVKRYALLKKVGVPELMASMGKLEGPYAPLKRFGNFVAVLKSQALRDAEQAQDTKKVEELKNSGAEHYVMKQFDTMGQAEEFARKNESAYPFTDAFASGERFTNSAVDGNMYRVLQKVLGAVKADKGMPTEARKAMEQTVRDMYLNSISEQNARQQGRQRKFRAGYDEDMIRSFLANAGANASFMANLEHGETINEAMYKMQREVKDGMGRRTGQDAFNLFAQHYADMYTYKPSNKFEDAAVGLTSAWQLSTSIGYHLTNATQGAMVTVPKLASDFNDYGGAWAALRQGYQVFGSIKSGTMTVDLKKVKNANLREALEHAANLGDLDVGIEEDLGHFNRFRTGYKLVDATSAVASSAMHKLRSLSRYVETMNRVAAGAAAYNMAIKHGKTVDEAKEYVINVLKDTQGDFSRAGSPLLLKKLPKVMTQYRKYQLMMAALYTKAYHQAFHGASAAEKAIGRRMLAFKLFHTSMAAGVLGWPMMNLAALVYGMLGDDDEPKDLETDLRAMIGDKDLADLLLRGPGAYFGLDMSAKLGDDKIFSIMPYTDIDFSSGKAALQTVGALVAGPAGAQAGRFLEGIDYMRQGDLYKGVERLVPKGLSSAMQSFRMANEGYTMRNGDVVVTAEDISATALLVNAIGMPATVLQDIKRANSNRYEVKQFFTDRTREIEHDYLKAFKEKDTAKMAELRKEWQTLQDGKDRQRALLGGNKEFLKRQALSTLLKYPQTHEKSAKSKMLNLED